MGVQKVKDLHGLCVCMYVRCEHARAWMRVCEVHVCQCACAWSVNTCMSLCVNVHMHGCDSVNVHVRKYVRESSHVCVCVATRIVFAHVYLLRSIHFGQLILRKGKNSQHGNRMPPLSVVSWVVVSTRGEALHVDARATKLEIGWLYLGFHDC